MTKLHPFHLVDIRPWPITTALGSLFLTSGLVFWFRGISINFFVLGVLVIIISAIQWWRDVTREGTFQGLHTLEVKTGLKGGMILFIVSEVIFFFSFFWAFFHRRLSPVNELGEIWPPTGVNPFNPFQVPLLNTIILLSSGRTVTWAHHSLTSRDHSSFLIRLSLTVFLGLYFTSLQAYEYMISEFSIADSVYGRTFFVATGFHGLHVIIGTIFLTVCLVRGAQGHFSRNHHFGFEAAAWYWHFVDVVWLFLYLIVYWWGS